MRRLFSAAATLLSLALIAGLAHAQSRAPAAGAEPPSPVTRDPAQVTFPRGYWDPEYRAKLIVVEFFGSDWLKRVALDPPPTGKAVLEEIRYLHSLVSLRAERREEIKLQNELNNLPFFFPVVMMHQSSHPRTYELMNAAYALSPAVYPFKHRFNRARPSQLAPTLSPMIVVPGHPAYPSGHGFVSWIVALTIAEVRPDARSELLETARRIGMNREVAGVHFPSDTKAGQQLAAQAFEIARQGRLFQELLVEAKAEWR
jgi:membrane-associated phospholipid phosphatase